MKENDMLSGGREGEIYRRKQRVIRPAHAWTGQIHHFLQFLRSEGAAFVPEPFGINKNGEEELSFLPGDVFHYPLPEEMKKDTILISAAELLTSFHSYSRKYLRFLPEKHTWMLPAVEPVEVMCHGDFAPYNVTIIQGRAAGIIDFDTLHPGSRMWDIAYAVYRWAPLKHPGHPDAFGTFEDQIRKTAMFMDAYGLEMDERRRLVPVLVHRLESLIRFMKKEADKGNHVFAGHLKDGHHLLYEKDIAYVKKQEQAIIEGITRNNR
ncbi:aminoglycoside phosphotransferase family protein [Alkalicoccus urumqiensis]|uniref:Aminoglycoside phosphotransferase domain-containing protein n=1 Tax=Alkalicoccus urumqiensis TaxID=1548213 RepID=A0A2P6ME13_ALKUR|nr:aminoglycoside phosphotransferase family protein [Alkalicoccus urumqiensis]PRO64510.1 hypothetical protein C6I21_14390 [Alkalicoccus urumqiensis]